MLVIHPESHVDHVPARGHRRRHPGVRGRRQPEKRGPHRDFELPEKAGTVACALYGPTMGDPPVSEDEVRYQVVPGGPGPVGRWLARSARPGP